MTSDNNYKQKRIEDQTVELSKIKNDHKDEIQNYINKLKENDKIVSNRITSFDQNMQELQNKLFEIKNELSQNMDSQLLQERNKLKMTAED